MILILLWVVESDNLIKIKHTFSREERTFYIQFQKVLNLKCSSDMGRTVSFCFALLCFDFLAALKKLFGQHFQAGQPDVLPPWRSDSAMITS